VVVRRSIVSIVLAGACFAWTAVPALAQTGSSLGGTGGSGSTTGFSLGSTGSGGTGLGGSGSALGGTGGTTGTGGRTGSNTGGGFTGSTAFGGGTTTGQLGTTLGTVSYGTTTYEGRYYGNPLAIGVPTTSSVGSQYLRNYPTTLTFGTPLYGSANVSTTTNRSTTNAYGTALTTQASPYSGASSSGIRRAPQYIAEPVFDRMPRPSASAMQANLQAIIARSSRLPSRNNVSVSMEGPVVVLRGQVRDERERRLTEGVVRMEPGVREVRNLLMPLAKSPPGRP
jgi:hypothetical protein